MTPAPGIALRTAGATALAIVLFSACAPVMKTVQDEEAAAAARVPPQGTMDVQFLTGKPELPPQLPYSLADETRGRWLTLFEVTASPVSTGSLPEAEEDLE